MNVEWSDDALVDLDRFSDFCATPIANRVAHETIAQAEMLGQYPRAGRSIAGREEHRQIVLQVLNARYVFQYRYDGERLVILRVYHGREARE